MAPDVNKIFDWGILGCGWLGRAWALDRIEAGESVWGSARRARILSELETAGIHPVAFDTSLEANEIWPRCRHLLVALPPSAGEETFQKAAAFGKDCDWTVLISSTSVYPDGDGHHTEDNAVRRISPHSGACLLDIESHFEAAQTTILRAGGLFGPGRHPGRFLRNRSLTNPADPVNMVHLTDVLSAIGHVQHNRIAGPCNLVSPTARSRGDFYGAAGAVTSSSPIPVRSEGRRILSDRLIDSGFAFRHPDPVTTVADMTPPTP